MWVTEGQYGYNKNTSLANWYYDITVRVDGKNCTGTVNCQVTGAGGTYMVIVNARGILGGGCRRETVRVELAVTPADRLAHNCHRDGPNCRPGLNSLEQKKWEGQGYSDEALCKLVQGNCVAQPRYSDPGDMETFVTTAMWF